MKNIAIVTGASSGIGAEFVTQIARKYPKLDEIWVIARRKERLLELAGRVLVPVKVLCLDLTTLQDVRELTNILEQLKPHVKMLVNCAGCGKVGDFELSSYEEQARILELNCKALTAVTYLCLPYMNDCSRIINIASVAAFLPQPHFAVYAASKSYVLSFSRALKREIKDRRVSVTVVCPGPVDTEFFEIADPDGEYPAYKELFVISAKHVVRVALQDAACGKEISIPGFFMKLLYVLTKILPHKVLLDIIYR